MTTLIARELAIRHALGFSLESPVIFRKAQHIIIAFPSNCVTGRQEFYHGLAVDKIYVTSPQGKQRAHQTLLSRAEAMKKAMCKQSLGYKVETIDTIGGAKMPLMDGFGSVMLSFDRVGKEFGDGTLRVHYWEERVVPLN